MTSWAERRSGQPIYALTHLNSPVYRFWDMTQTPYFLPRRILLFGEYVLVWGDFSPQVTFMFGHRKASQNRPEAPRLPCLLVYKYNTPVSPLECALPHCPATVLSKRLTGLAKSFRMRTYAKTGGRGTHPFPPSHSLFTPKGTFLGTLRLLRSSGCHSLPWLPASERKTRISCQVRSRRAKLFPRREPSDPCESISPARLAPASRRSISDRPFPGDSGTWHWKARLLLRPPAAAPPGSTPRSDSKPSPACPPSWEPSENHGVPFGPGSKLP